MNFARRVWGSCLLITVCMGSFGIAGLSLGFGVTLLVSLAALEPALVKQRLSRLPLLLSAGLFLLWGLLTLAWTEASSLLTPLSNWSHWLILIPAAGFMMTDDVRHGIWRALVAVQLIVAIWSIYVGIDCAIDWNPYPNAGDCMNKRIPHGNTQASWMLGFSSLLALIWLEGRWRWACASVLALPLLLMGGLTAFILLAAGLAVAFICSVPLKPWRLQVLIAAAAFGIVGVMFNPMLQADIHALIQSSEHNLAQTVHSEETGKQGPRASTAGSGQDSQSSAAERMAFWRASALAIRDRPLIGHGMGSWSEVYRGFHPQVQGPASSVNPQSSYLHLAVEQGLIGLCLFLGLLAALWQAARWLTGFEAVAFRMLIVSFSVASLFYSWTHDAGASRMFLVLMVLCLAGLRAPQQASTGPVHPKGEPNLNSRSPARERRSKKVKP